MLSSFLSGRTDVATSRFHYRTGFSHADYQFPGFIPLFTEDYNDTQLADAAQVCGSRDNFACIYDYLATLNEAIANQTKAYSEDAVVISTEASKCILHNILSMSYFHHGHV